MFSGLGRNDAARLPSRQAGRKTNRPWSRRRPMEAPFIPGLSCFLPYRGPLLPTAVISDSVDSTGCVLRRAINVSGRRKMATSVRVVLVICALALLVGVKHATKPIAGFVAR